MEEWLNDFGRELLYDEFLLDCEWEDYENFEEWAEVNHDYVVQQYLKDYGIDEEF